MRLTEEATVGERVAFYRRRQGMTQEVLSELLRRSVDWLSKLERGVIELDRLSTIVHAMLRQMLRRDRRRRRGLRELAAFVGVG